MHDTNELDRLFECWSEGHSFEDFYHDVNNALRDNAAELQRLRAAVANAALERMAADERRLGIQMQPAVPDEIHHTDMNEAMKQAWLEASRMSGDTTPEALDVFLRTWQRASQATRKALAEQPAQRPWQGLTDEDWKQLYDEFAMGQELDEFAEAIEAKLKEKNT